MSQRAPETQGGRNTAPDTPWPRPHTSAPPTRPRTTAPAPLHRPQRCVPGTDHFCVSVRSALTSHSCTRLYHQLKMQSPEKTRRVALRVTITHPKPWSPSRPRISARLAYLSPCGQPRTRHRGSKPISEQSLKPQLLLLIRTPTMGGVCVRACARVSPHGGPCQVRPLRPKRGRRREPSWSPLLPLVAGGPPCRREVGHRS